jgi:hypothetical protein
VQAVLALFPLEDDAWYEMERQVVKLKGCVRVLGSPLSSIRAFHQYAIHPLQVYNAPGASFRINSFRMVCNNRESGKSVGHSSGV